MLNVIRRELHPLWLLPALSAGLAIGVICIVIRISFAALIFSGDLSPYVAHGIGLILFGGLVMGLIASLTSSFPGSIALSQDSPAAILALVAGAIAATMAASSTHEALLWTVIAAIVISSLFTGVCSFILGWFRLGNLVRFVPYPVIGGFLAGTGWLLVQGAFGVLTGTPLSLTHLSQLFQGDELLRWLPGLALAVVLFALLRRYSHFLIMPTTLAAAIGVFYLVLFLTQMPLAQAEAEGWLLGPFPAGVIWQPLTLPVLAQVDWAVLLGQLDKIGTILLISVVSLLLNASGLELAVRRDIDLNLEMRSTGLANVLAGLGGGPAGYQSLSLSTLAHRLAPDRRLVGILAAGLSGLMLLFGTSLLSFIPKPLLGGLLLFLGLTFLADWLYQTWFRLSRTDYLLILLIVGIVATVGFLPGVAAGVAIAIVLFVVNYSRIDVIKHMLSGANYQSAVDRPPPQRQILQVKGEELYILKLQGFVFFGTAQSLVERIRRRVSEAQHRRPHFLVLSFRRVTGLDSSAVSSLVRLRQWAQTQQISLVLADLSSELERQLARGGLTGAEAPPRLFPTLDHAVEWCEDQILLSEEISGAEAPPALPEQLESQFPQPQRVSALMAYLEKTVLGAGSYLFRQGDPAGDLYFIESGQLTVQLEFPAEKPLRLRTLRAGTVVGEVGLYLREGTRTASVIAVQPSTLYRLSARSLQQLEESDPALASAFHQYLARLMAERLARSVATLEALLD